MKKNVKKLLALLLAAIMLLSLAACGKDETADVTGKYNCIAIAEDGVNFTAPENNDQYVELKKGGKGEIYTDLAFELTWKLDGENFSGSYQIFGIDAPITGTLKDGVLKIHDDEMVMRYLKEGAEAPGWAKDVAAAPEKGCLAGMYTLYAMEIAGKRYDYAALVEMNMMDGSYMRIDYGPAAGYPGELSFEGEESDAFTLEDELGMLNFPSGEQMGFFEDEPGVVGITQEDLGGTIFFALDSVERPEVTAAAAVEEISDPLLEFWNGDWYGWWFMYGCKGSYEDLEGAYWDCEAHIEIDPDTYTGTMELWDDAQYQNMGGIGLADVSLSESGTGTHGTLMSEGGWFEEKTLSHADWIIDPGLDESDNFLIITGDYDDDNGNVYYYKMMMRKWGELWEDIDESSRPWSYENWYKTMIEDGVTKMSVCFGDPDPSVYEDLEPQTEDQEPQNEDVSGSETGVSTAGYGKSNAAATGEVTLDTLKSSIGWQSHWDGSLLSLELTAGQPDGEVYHDLYYFDFETQTRLTAEDVLTRMGLSWDALEPALVRAAAREHDRMMQAQDLAFTNDLIADTLALRAQSVLAAQDAALPLYPNGDGTLTVYLNLATYAGAGWMQTACVVDPKEPVIPLSASYEFVTTEVTADGAVTVEFHARGEEFSGVDYQRIYGFAFDTPYTIRGCFGCYTGLFIGSVGSSFEPYLFLRTEDGTLEYVDLFRCVRYETYVCGGLLYGISGVTALSAGIEEKADYSYATVYALDRSGKTHDLLEAVYLSDGLPYEMQADFGCEGADGAWCSLSLDAMDGINAQSGDTSYTGFPLRLGLSEDGMIYALDFWDDAGGETLSICALLPGNGMLMLTQLAGGSPFGLSPGETLYLPETYG